MTFADLHCHTEYSVLDGESRCSEAAARAAANGSAALAITDHGTCAGHVDFQKEALAAGISPVFGIETYFQPDRLVRPPGTAEARARRDAVLESNGGRPTPLSDQLTRQIEEAQALQSSLRSGKHMILLAQSDAGLHDLWAASTEAYVTGFYGKPRMDWALLEERGSDLICTTACLGGVVADDILNGRIPQAVATLERLKSIFGDRLYLEIQGNELALQRRMNILLAEAGEVLGIPLVATCDAHYPSPAEAELHRQWMACQAGGGKDDYWHFSPMLTEEALRGYLGYLDPEVVDRAIWNAGEIAARCDARIGGHADPPVFTPGGTHADDAAALRALCEANWGKVEHLGSEYRDRMEHEFARVARKGLAGCYLIVHDLIEFCRSRGILVGPGRGSAAGSLISYVIGITSGDPIRSGLLFERFLTDGREDLPDFDLDFPSPDRPVIQDYAANRYGDDHVVRVGTIMRYQAKGILNKLFSVHARDLPESAQADSSAISKLIDAAEAGTAGLGLPWDEIMQDPEIAEFREKYGRIFALAEQLQDRVYAQGKHPAGLVISPQQSLTGTMPMRHAAADDRLMVSQWDYRAIEKLGRLKIDILTLRNLHSVQECIRLVEARTGIRLDPRSWDVEHMDPQVFDAIGTGQTTGVFQLETSLSSDFSRRLKPLNLAQVAALTTIIRPGPRNSGAAERYLARKAGTEPVTYPHPLLEEVLADSYGLLIYQEHILAACTILAGYSELEADGVRKVLGKKLVDKIDAAGEEFIRRSTERGHDEEAMRSLWADMAEFGKYAFNKAHGFMYGTLSYWTAWLKEHYPVEFFTAVMSTAKMERLPEFAVEARRIGITVLPPDARFSPGGFTCEGTTIRYGLSAVRGMGPAKIKKVTAGQPYTSYEDYLARSGADAGVTYSLARAGALDPLVPSRRGLLRLIEADRDGSSVRCLHKNEQARGPNLLPCEYDWDNEPAVEVPVKRASGTVLKLVAKPPPKRCTVACRQYSPPSQEGMAGWPEYPAGELFRRDLEMYGTWMSPAPFERLDEISPGLRARSAKMARAIATAVPNIYPVEGVLADVHRAMTKKGTAMWWVKLATEVSVLDLACFSPLRDSEPDVPVMLSGMRPGTLVSAEVDKHPYMSKGGPRMGWRLAAVYPIG